jgi:hypothetical protein
VVWDTLHCGSSWPSCIVSRYFTLVAHVLGFRGAITTS